MKNIKETKKKILEALEGKDKEEIQEELLEEFGFIWITDIGTHADGGLLITQGVDKEYKDWELWVDWKKKRILLYNPERDLELIEGDLTKKEDKIYYN